VFSALASSDAIAETIAVLGQSPGWSLVFQLCSALSVSTPEPIRRDRPRMRFVFQSSVDMLPFRRGYGIIPIM
jgi:hypothetical protein